MAAVRRRAAVQLAGDDLESLRLAYAQHIYPATVERSVVLTGGWQTSKETAYVEATRARHGTTWLIARDDLGEEGQDAARLTRLAQKMTNSRTRTPSLAYLERPERGWEPSRNPLQLRSALSPTHWLTRALNRDTPDRRVGRGR